jgi:hypothetical protein
LFLLSLSVHSAPHHLVSFPPIPPWLCAGDLKQIAEAIAPVDRVAIIRDDRGASKGVAVITYSAKEGADRATATLHGIDVGGRRIKVREAAAATATGWARPAPV